MFSNEMLADMVPKMEKKAACFISYSQEAAKKLANGIKEEEKRYDGSIPCEDEVLVVSIDRSNGEDVTVLHVGILHEDGAMTSINTLFGNHAEYIYHELMRKQNHSSMQQWMEYTKGGHFK